MREDDRSPVSRICQERTFAQKLDQLFVTIHPKDRGEFTYQEVADGVASLGEPKAKSYICMLRNGQRDNPSMRHVVALARFFKVPITYFVGTPEQVESVAAQLRVVQALQDGRVADIAMRASRLTTAGLDAVAGIIDQLQKVPGMTHRSRRTPGITGAPAATRTTEASNGGHQGTTTPGPSLGRGPRSSSR